MCYRGYYTSVATTQRNKQQTPRRRGLWCMEMCVLCTIHVISVTVRIDVRYTTYMQSLQHLRRGGDRCFAVFDIAASTIGVALGVRRGDSTIILWSSRLSYGFGREHGEYEHYIKNMLATLLEAGMSMLHDGLRVAQRDPGFKVRDLEVMGVFGPPWFFGDVRHGVCTFSSRRAVTHGKLDELRGAMYSAVLEASEYESWQTVAGPGELLEQYDIALHLDGYHIVQKQQYEATDVQLTTYLAVASQHVVAKVGDIIRRVFPNHSVRMTTSTRLLSEYRLTQQHEESRELLVEIGGQVTSVTLLEQGRLEGVAAIPTGTHALFQSAAPQAKSIEEAKSACLLLLKDAKEGAVPKTLQKALAAWQEQVHEAIQKACNGVTPPSAVLAVVAPEWYTLYATALEEPWQQPGLQEMRGYNVSSLTLTTTPPDEAASSVLGAHSDMRLQVLLAAVDDVGASA